MPPNPAAPFSDITTHGESVPSINDGPQCELVQLDLNYSQDQIESRQSLLRLFEEKNILSHQETFTNYVSSVMLSLENFRENGRGI